MKIGVFDSGIGGLSVATALEMGLPGNEVIFADDRQHLPYGTKSPDELLGYVVPILEDLVKQDCGLIVIACNTVTTTLISELRQRVSVPLVGIEPMVKPASERTKTGVIAVCATPTTLASERYAELKATYAQKVEVLEPDCSEWSAMIEDNNVNHRKIAAEINDVCEKKADVIVLGCTHYHWIEEVIRQVANGRAEVIQPEAAIVKQVERLLATVKQP